MYSNINNFNNNNSKNFFNKNFNSENYKDYKKNNYINNINNINTTNSIMKINTDSNKSLKIFKNGNRKTQEILLPLINKKITITEQDLDKDNFPSIINTKYNDKENIERFNHRSRLENYQVLLTK
jgi:hypothetical protein